MRLFMGLREKRVVICVECKDGHHSDCLRTYERCDCPICALLGDVVVHTEFEHAPESPPDEPTT